MPSLVSIFEVIFDRSNSQYNEGEEIKGRVLIDLVEDIVIERLTLDLSGSAVVDWLVLPTGTKETNLGELQENYAENYLNQKLILYSRDKETQDDDSPSTENIELLVSRGRHEYPFRVQLPYSLPSSFVGDHGCIKYIATAMMEHPWSSPVVTSKEFTIHSILDLNTLPHVQVATQCHEESRSIFRCGFPCMSKPGHVMIWRLDQTGYVPGQKIRINGEVHNNSKTSIRKSMAMLIQHVQYCDIWGNTTRERKKVAQMEKGPIQGGHIGFWRDEMEVPPLPPTGFKDCSVIEVSYTLKFKVFPNILFKPIETSIDITIGTIAVAGLPVNQDRIPHSSLLDTRSLGRSDSALDMVEDFNYFI